MLFHLSWLRKKALVIWLLGKTYRVELKQTNITFSNAIGSNVFDINLGLGLPFLIFTCIKGPVSLLNGQQWVSFLIG